MRGVLRRGFVASRGVLHGAVPVADADRSECVFDTSFNGLDPITAHYTSEQLDTIAAFLHQVARMQQQAALDVEVAPTEPGER